MDRIRHFSAAALSLSLLTICGCQTQPTAPTPNSSVGTVSSIGPGEEPSAGPPILQSVTLRTNVPTGGGGFVSVVPDFRFTAPGGNAVVLRRELVATDAAISQTQIRNATINIAPDVQKSGAEISGAWRCGVAQYYVTIRAYIITADGQRSNAIQYTIHCNGG